MIGKTNIDFNKLKDLIIEIPKIPKINPVDFNFNNSIVSQEELSERQIEKQNEILNFLKDVTIQQAKTAQRQSKNNRWMTILALIFAFISIMPILREWISPHQPKNLNHNISELESQLLLETNKTSELSIRLLDLQNQVQNLEKKNAEASKINN